MKNTKMLKKNYEFKNVLTKGKYYSGNYLEAFILKNRFDINYLGLAISIKVGKATKRNYIKRLIRESYKIAENNIKTGYSIVFLWKKKALFENATYKNVKEDINIIFNSAKIYIDRENT